ncbi:RNA-binding protein 8A [Orchesella cincta]|uniref:RNA-binding protein 8A n=1 Tax=Orchesella cincta TaxID=48709 RepID=A0A1D2MK20_ORCCI|nr:RNA-binding protein 8A [Orchesella cincta]
MSDMLELDISHQDSEGEERMIIEESAGIGKLKQQVRKRKGRGFASADKTVRREVLLDNFERVRTARADEKEGVDVQAQRSAEGWILIVTGIHEEGHEEDVQEKFAEFGKIKSIRLDLDHRTGFLKGYSFVEFENFKDAVTAKEALNETELLGNTIRVDWAFMKKPISTGGRSRRHQ